MASRRFIFGEGFTAEGVELYLMIKKRSFPRVEDQKAKESSLEVYCVDDIALAVNVCDAEYVTSGTLVGRKKDVDEAVDVFNLKVYLRRPKW